MNRRTVLRAGAAGTGTMLAGCLGQLQSNAPSPQTPDGCPASQDLDVERPDEFTPDAVRSFVEAYESAYYRERVVEYEPETPLDEYQLGVNAEQPTESEAGYEVELSGGGGVYTPTLMATATAANPPENAEVYPSDALEGDLAALLSEAAETPGEEADHHVRDSPAIARHVEAINALADGTPLADNGDSTTLYFEVDGTTVELSVHATSLHGDYWWRVWYYVDEHVVRRTDEEDADPADGELLECHAEG